MLRTRRILKNILNLKKNNFVPYEVFFQVIEESKMYS